MVSSQNFAQALKKFSQQLKLSARQLDQFEQYLNLLIEWNEKFNITAITDPRAIITYHFLDSLAVRSFVDFSTISSVADVGAGGGFPGLPLKILFPDLHVTLIEVNNKKVDFLNHVIQALELENVVVVDVDWRTFLRKTTYPIDLFLARASLAPEELIRMFRKNCFYQDKTLIYWASTDYQLGAKEQPYFSREVTYTVGKERKLFFFTGDTQ